MKKIDEYMNLPYRIEIIPDVYEGGFVASFPDLPGCITSGESMEEVLANVDDAKREWLAASIESGVEIPEPDTMDNYSGQFKLRLPKSLHYDLSRHARSEGISMNQYCLYLLAKNDARHHT